MSNADAKTILQTRFREVDDLIRAACTRAGRARDSVTLIAVTKTVSAEIAALLPELGINDLGESRPQALWRKAALLPKSIRWHLVGHLQRNKIESTLPLVQMIHSVDTLRLLETLESAAAKQQQIFPVLLEVNASGETAKHGFGLEELPPLCPRLATVKNLRICGLMTMAAYNETPENCRPTFVALRQLRDRLQNELGSSHHLEHLSMGMTNDYEVAIEGRHAGTRRHRLVRWLAGTGLMIALAEHAEGIILPVRAQPGARKAGILGEQAGSLKVAVTAQPEDGKANKALIEVLRDALDLKRSQVELLSGQTSREKRFLIRGESKASLQDRLIEIIGM